MKANPYWTAAGLGLALLVSTGTLPAEQFAIEVGNTVAEGVPGAGAGRIDVHTDFDTYTFTGTNGQAVFFEDLSAAAAFAGYLRWEVKAPGGTTVLNSYLDANIEGRKTLPETGTYTLRVWVGTANAAYIGTYAFRLRAIPPDQSFPIQIGDTITNGLPAAGSGNIEAPGAWDYYTFNATNGQLVFFETLNVASTFQGNLYCELKSPASNVVFSGYLTTANHPGRKTLDEAGTYRLRVFAQSNKTNHVGTYSLRLRAIPPDQTFAIQPGDTVTNGLPASGAGNLEVPGAQDFYTFPGTAGQSLSFQGISSSASFAGWLRWEAIAPSGASVFNAHFGDVGRKTLSETGTYRIRVWVGANNPAYVGVYSFRTYTLLGDVSCAIQKGDVVADGVPIAGAGRIDQPGGLDTYTFNGLAGQRVNFDQLSAAAAFDGYLYWQVLKPSGTALFTGYFPGNATQRHTLPETGTYTIRVYPQTPNTTYVGAYSFRTWCEVSAGPDQFATLPNTPLVIPLNKFLCNDGAEIGDVTTLDTTNTTSVHGGTLALSSAALTYTPSSGFSGSDRFTYRLRGQFGDEDYAVATVHVGAGVDQGATVVSLVREGPSIVRVCLLGAPNQGYRVEQSDNLMRWTEIGSLTADATGSMNYNYTIQPKNGCWKT